MSLGPAPLSSPVLAGDTHQAAAPWRAWISQLFGVVQALGTQGTTAQRPIGTPTVPLYLGQSYFDQTLGYPVWIKSLSPTVWVNATGAVV